MPNLDIEKFITRWKGSGGNEMANFQSFANELVNVLGVETIKVADAEGQNNDYRFERPVKFTHTGKERRGRIDLYRRGCFVLEAKQGSNDKYKTDENQLSFLGESDAPKQQGHGKRGTAKFDDTMLKARNQADNYARAVAKEDGWPPFLIIVDVGHVIELYADFSGQGQGYNQFPDGNRYRILLEDLYDENIRNLLHRIWTNPNSLDPSLEAAAVTREIATHLAELGKSFEAQGHDSETVARFLMRCLFSMFAEDVELIPKASFTDMLKKLRDHPEHAEPALKGLWETMNTGGFSQALMQDLKRFNGGLFKDASSLPLNNLQLGLLIEAAEADWKQVEPAIFGTLLERALDKRQRHKLGAHYTPRAYVERLVTPTIMEPLREDWRDVQTAVQRLAEDGKDDEAIALVRDFHNKLCEIRVLDPACGSGNFLYVALERMKRLEGEVTALLEELGETQTTFITVDPHQFLGIELNPWAANVAELVLWIGYLQWHFRTHGTASPSEPVLRDFQNIKNADAILEWSDRTPRLDDEGNPVTRWDGITTIQHNITGEEVPDPNARVQVYDYSKPKATKWPEADFIIGNPPFIGNKRMRDDLGDGYVEALWQAYPKMPQSSDFVMFWWDKAARIAQFYKTTEKIGARRFGLITTDSAKQYYARRVIEVFLSHTKKPLSILFAIPDHPWVDSSNGAAVRIAMTVVASGKHSGRSLKILSETKSDFDKEAYSCEFSEDLGRLYSTLTIGPDIGSVKPLLANSQLCFQGCKLVGSGFQILDNQRKLFLESGANGNIFPQYISGSDIAKIERLRYVIDYTGFSSEDAKKFSPEAFQHLVDNVKPERDGNRDKTFREKWWLFGRPRHEMRHSLNGINIYFATSEVSKHRFFKTYKWPQQLIDGGAVAICCNDFSVFSVLHSRIHWTWSLASSGNLGVTPRYQNALSFDPYPFPEIPDDLVGKLYSLGENLNTHRKRQQAAHPKLTLTQMYNVLEMVRAGKTIEGKDREIYDQGLIGILKDLHDQIDEAVADAYGWPVDLSDEDILYRLVALNKERAEEEANGHIRWLRPEYQNPEGKQQTTGKNTEMDLDVVATVEKAAWPKALPEQIAAVREALLEMGEASPDQIARQFKRARTSSVEPLLESLSALGQAEKLDNGNFVA